MVRLNDFCESILSRFSDSSLDNVTYNIILELICNRYNLHTNHISSKNKILYDEENNIIGEIKLGNSIMLSKHKTKYFLLHEGEFNTILILKTDKNYECI